MNNNKKNVVCEVLGTYVIHLLLQYTIKRKQKQKNPKNTKIYVF